MSAMIWYYLAGLTSGAIICMLAFISLYASYVTKQKHEGAKMIAITQGRRLADRNVFKVGGLVHGDYVKVVVDGITTWYACPPRGGIGPLTNHVITEHENGTITASPSILMPSQDPRQYWHGYLEHGVWREV